MRTTLLAFALVVVGGCSRGTGEATAADELKKNVTESYDFGSLEQLLFGGDFKTDGAIVLKDGQIVYERYANGYDETKRHIGYSVSKSVGSALVGIAVNDGLMKVEDSVCKYMDAPEGADPTFCTTTIAQLLWMTGGLSWTEDYSDPSTSTVLQMLYGDESDMGAYAAKQPRVAAAGSTFNYSSGGSNILARALKNALHGQNMAAWAKKKLFEPAGMTSAFFEADHSGTLVFSSGCFMTPRDMAKFGQLYLGAATAKSPVIPSSWVDFTKAPAPPFATAGGSGYGAAFWLGTKPVPIFSAEGHWGQKIIVVPSQKLIVVRTGNDRTHDPDSGEIVKRVIDATGGGK